MKVWKFDVIADEHFGNSYECTIYVPKRTEFLHVRTKGDELYVWGKFEEQNEHNTESRTLIVLPTGEPIPEEKHRYFYIGTVLDENGQIFHVFEQRDK